MGKYDHLVYTFQKQESHWQGNFMPKYQAYFRGHDCMKDSSFYSSYRCYMADAFIDRTPNFHTEYEYLCFTGYDMQDPWGSFDAEIEFWIGKDLNNLEKHVFTKPTIICIPPHMWHCPLEFRNVKKPVFLQVLHTRGKFATFSYERTADGSYQIAYNSVSGARKCRTDPSKNCTVCGKCMAFKPKVDEPQDPETAALSYKDAKV